MKNSRNVDDGSVTAVHVVIILDEGGDIGELRCGFRADV
jgi:hypothetical protein